MYESKIAVIDALRKAFESFKHLKEFNARAKPYIEKQLPGYSLHLYVDKSFGSTIYHLEVFGVDIEYANCIHLHWTDKVNNQVVGWQGGFLNALDIADMHDYQERQVQEQNLIPTLERLDAEVKERIRAARVLVESLPVPHSATIRAAPHFWTSASYELSDRFPVLFKSDID